MNLSLLDPFVLAQDCPEALIGRLRMASTSAMSYSCYALASLENLAANFSAADSGHSSCIRFNKRGDLLASGRVG